MKILKKRATAIFIDCSILVFVMAGLAEIFKLYLPVLADWVELLLITLFFKDALFQNASIGKKIVGIEIYDVNWDKPTFKALVKRSVFMYTAGYVLMYKLYFIDGTFIDIFDWERERLHTRVIDKKVYKELSEEAKKEGSNFSKKMSELYDAYLRDLYMK